MATYCISDIHGQLVAFDDLLARSDINLNTDTLYILGDMIDWGTEPIGVLKRVYDLAHTYPNVKVTLGNHELLMLSSAIDKICRGTLRRDVWGVSWRKYTFEVWLNNSGEVTVRGIMRLYKEDTAFANKLFDWLRTLPAYYEDEKYVYAHATQTNGEYVSDHLGFLHNDFKRGMIGCVWERIDPVKFCLPSGKMLIAGHTPTVHYQHSSDIFKSKNYICIDCGAKCLGERVGTAADIIGKLCMYCVDNGKTWYSIKKNNI